MSDPRVATEQQTQRAISEYLQFKGVIIFKHRNVGIYKKETNQYIPLPDGERGISDLIGCTKRGQFIAIEVKKKGGKPTQNQLEFIERVRANGGISILAYSLEDVVEETKAIL